MLTLSVVIPALDAAKTLPYTLMALCESSVKAEEILIVDGLSSDRTAEIARSFGCVVISNSQRHTAAARQLGVEAAQGSIVAMTDADCVPGPNWLASIREHYSHDTTLDGVGGAVRLSHPHNRVQAYCASKAVTGIPEQAELITRKAMRGRFSGANCAYRRQLILDAGGFDYSFKALGEDIDLFWRLVDRQSRLLFDPALSVEHLGFAKEYATLARKGFGYGIASTRLERCHFPGRRPSLSLLWRPWSAAVRELLRRNKPRYGLCVFVDRLMFGMGRFWGTLHK